MIYNNKLKRAKLEKITQQFIDNINKFEIFKIPDKLYLDYFDQLKKLFNNYKFDDDDRFFTYGRLDFLKKELTERLNDTKLEKESPNWKDKWDNRLGAFWDLYDYIRGDRHFTPGNIPDGMNFRDMLIMNDQYYKDGYICKQEKDILLEMINEIVLFIESKQRRKNETSPDLRKLIFKIEDHDWGMKTIYSWNTKVWYIYDDLSVEFKISNGEDKVKSYSHNISSFDLQQIFKNIELAKLNNHVVEAFDGEAWEFTQYKDNVIVWERELGYIYGIEPLENICDILFNLVKQDSDIFTDNEMEENDMGLFSKKDKYNVDVEKNRPQIVYGIPDALRKQWEEEEKKKKKEDNKYNIDPSDNVPQKVYGVPNYDFSQDKNENKEKYDINPEDNVPREVYGIPSPIKKELDKAKDKYEVKPEKNNPQRVYGVMNPEKFELDLNKKNKESISVIIDDYCLSLTKWDNTCDLLFMNKSKVSFIKDSIVSISLEKYDKFVSKINAIVSDWENEYIGEKNIKWQIKFNTKELNKIIVGNGEYPLNWNKFIELISEYEILFKKTIIYNSKESKLNLNASFDEIVKEKVNDPFWEKLISDYLKQEIDKNETVLKIIFKDLSKYDDIFNEFTKYVVQKNYDIPNAISVEGYTAKKIAELNPNFKPTGVYTFLKYLREQPEEAKKTIAKGFPNKDSIQNHEKKLKSISATEKIGIPTKQFENTILFVSEDGLIAAVYNQRESITSEKFDKICDVVYQSQSKLREIAKQQTQEFLSSHVMYDDTVRKFIVKLEAEEFNLSYHTGTESDQYILNLINEIIGIIKDNSNNEKDINGKKSQEVVTREDWAKPMPEQNIVFKMDRVLTESEIDILKRGHKPEVMEDKWYWYVENNILNIHRSWTGNCLFKVELNTSGKLKVIANRDPEQYKETSVEKDKENINRLLDYWTKEDYDYYEQFISETYNNLVNSGLIKDENIDS